MRTYQHEVKYYECDRMGITHHSNYVRFMEEARVDWMGQIGYGFERMEAEGVVSPVVSVECNFKRPTTFKDVVEIEVKVEEMSALKITFGYTMRIGDKVVFTGRSVHCFMENGRPVKLAERFPQLYEKCLNVLTC